MITAAFIGTFDPLHGAHIGQLLRAYWFVPFSNVLILVHKHPVHKPHASSWQHRAKMARLGLESFELPFEYRVIPIESPLLSDLSEKVDYKITGIDSLIEDLMDSARWIAAQHYPLIVLSIPGIEESGLTNAVSALPKDVQRSVVYEYISEADVPMMNYDFERQMFIAERVHSRYLRSGEQKALIPRPVQSYIQEHHLYK